MLETLDWFEEPPGWFACVLPTAVLQTAATYRTAWTKLIDSEASALMTVVRCPTPPEISFSITTDDRLDRILSDAPRLPRTQDYPPHYWDAGQFYFLHSEGLANRDSLLGHNPYCFELSELDAQDIDSPEDWELAILKLQRLLDLELIR